jgi:hypothetical protein
MKKTATTYRMVIPMCDLHNFVKLSKICATGLSLFRVFIYRTSHMLSIYLFSYVLVFDLKDEFVLLLSVKHLFVREAN